MPNHCCSSVARRELGLIAEEEEEETAATDDSHRSNYQNTPEKKAQDIIQRVQGIFATFQEVGANISLRSGPRLVSKI
jgi:hypothetical protein